MILLHGGLFFTSGNDLKIAEEKRNARLHLSIEERTKLTREAMMGALYPMCMNLANCSKPIVAVVRGGCHGIGFTMLTQADFVYVDPNVIFKTPFMMSF